MIDPTEAMSNDRERMVSLATDEFMERIERGETVDIDQFVTKFASVEGVLRRLLPALEILREAKTDSTDYSPHLTDEIGQALGLDSQLGDFQVVREVGRGGMGVVYEAHQQSLKRTVALKILPFASTLDPQRIRRFRNEALAVASLDHPCIAEIYGVGCERGLHYYAMRLIDGPSLAEVLLSLKQSPFVSKRESDTERPHQSTAKVANSGYRTPESLSKRGRPYLRSVAVLIAAIADALDHAHQLGIVHRDVKPGNLLVDSTGKPWITDFGLAQINTGETMTMSGDLLGTLRYMAPEQIDSGMPVDYRVDIYALGATFYELLTLRPMIQTSERLRIIDQVRSATPTSPSRLNSDIPRELETIVQRATEKAPSSRYQTAAALAADLRAWLDGKPIVARPSSRFDKAWSWCKRNPTVAGLVSAVLLLTVSIAIVASVAAIVTNRLLIAERNANSREQTALAEEQQARQRAEELAARNIELASNKDQVLSFLTSEVFGQANPAVEGDRDISFRQVLDNSAVAARKLDLAPEIKAEILIELGKVYFSLSEYPSSLELFEAAYDVGISTQTETHPVVMTALDQQAMVLIRMEKFEQAMPILERAIRLQNAVLGPDHEDSIHSYAKLGDLYERSGRIEQAIAITEEVLARRIKLFGATYPFVLVSMNGLALSYQQVGRYKEAVALLSEAARVSTEVLGELHPDVLAFKNNLALALINVDDLEDALSLAEYALEERRKILPEEHSDVFASRHTVAKVWFAMGDYTECLEECQAMFALYSEPSIRFGRVKILIGQCLLELEQPSAAAAELEFARELLTERLGPSNRYSAEASAVLKQLD